MKSIVRTTLFLICTALPVAGFATEKGEVEALVMKAVDYWKENGQEEAVKAINNKEGEFVKGSVYVYASSDDGVVLAHGARPELAGQDLSGAKTPDGQDLGNILAEKAENKGESGWVTYKWPHPETDEPATKHTYVYAVEDDVIIAAGMYDE